MARENKQELGSLLTAKGAVVDQRKRDGATPLFMAAQNGHTAMVRLLLGLGAKTDSTLSLIHI